MMDRFKVNRVTICVISVFDTEYRCWQGSDFKYLRPDFDCGIEVWDLEDGEPRDFSASFNREQLAKSSSERLRPSSVKTTDLALPTGSLMKPFS
jgi:hypothetical protein